MSYRVGLMVAEAKIDYQTETPQPQWIEVLVDCPGAQGLYTYRIPPDLAVKPGDILSVPFGSQIVGGIAIRQVDSPPPDLELSRIRAVEEVVSEGFFSENYWNLLIKVAEYYCTSLITVIRSALPPGLLGRSQRRLRLKRDQIPDGAEVFCSFNAQQVLRLLNAQKDGDYSHKYLQNKIRGARQGIRELVKRGWVESYLDYPKPARPKTQKAVTLVIDSFPSDLTAKQRHVLEILRHRGGELWLTELAKIAQSSTSIVESLGKKGYVVIQYREQLRLLNHPEQESDRPKSLTPAQATALQSITNRQGFAEVLLHGVTGSGKTEVYLQAIEPLLEKKQSALVIVPEIGLTPQLTARFRARFGNRVCVYHSGLSTGERFDTWRQMLTGEPQVVIGTRSAIFAPLPRLGVIILDEEHDSSLKQTQILPPYHARRVAQWRAELENCPLILGSATPSLESWINAQEAPSNYLSLPQRIQNRPLPPVEIVDLRQELKRGNRSIFSLALQEALANLKSQQKQAILFISRRGHSTFVSCRSCGYVMECPHCDVSLSYHYTHEGATELLRCHYCNYTCLHPSKCPECSSPYLKFFGSGTQKVTQELTKLFPELRWLRFDSDTTRGKDAHRRLLTQFTNGEADVLVGTQMLTKGLDIENVTLVGIVAADGLLHFSNYRAAERAFQTLTQVAGRAGRGDDPGRVILQTYSPEHPVIQAVKNHDYLGFIEAELPQREALSYPPYGRLILLRFSGLDEIEVQETTEKIAEVCQDLIGSSGEILGPAPASVMRVSRRYRWQILLKFELANSFEVSVLKELFSLCPQSVSMMIDIDPMSID